MRLSISRRWVGKTEPRMVAEDIHLGAVLYYGPERWTLWLQGKRWTPATVNDDYAHYIG